MNRIRIASREIQYTTVTGEDATNAIVNFATPSSLVLSLDTNIKMKGIGMVFDVANFSDPAEMRTLQKWMSTIILYKGGSAIQLPFTNTVTSAFRLSNDSPFIEFGEPVVVDQIYVPVFVLAEILPVTPAVLLAGSMYASVRWWFQEEENTM